MGVKNIQMSTRSKDTQQTLQSTSEDPGPMMAFRHRTGSIHNRCTSSAFLCPTRPYPDGGTTVQYIPEQTVLLGESWLCSLLRLLTNIMIRYPKRYSELHAINHFADLGYTGEVRLEAGCHAHDLVRQILRAQTPDKPNCTIQGLAETLLRNLSIP